ncbi:helix-turn-helix transcriptional regulator [Paenibacillus sp. OAS669]|uniref:helix-turn-helix transcriptional regulator n=1 Tax=Paenibacillus sp. OAS669 TaxID=2663821 RepID=UPI001788EC55|nr:helix-turn-helix transcriptional regulator [Paenibacillus sp. OAS669]MBE1444060.1 transcriptional regulator with XRE-family HTH domain [Paenibacillus sp. OAS669]
MNHQTRLQALSAFLKAQRAKITPESAGLVSGSRRRTPGLRREEVAQLAGVSATWYTWLEQGRDIKVSASVLDCVATALRLTVDERKYLFSLALDTGSGAGASLLREDQPRISPSLQTILQELRNCPTIISDRRFQIVGWNQAASHVFLDFDQVPVEQRNIIRLLFTRKEFRSLAVNWEHFASGFLSIFRSYYGQYVDDEWYEQFLEEMKSLHPEFHSLWERSTVSSAPEVLIEFRHGKAGKMLFHLTSLQVQGDADLRCSIYTPAPDTSTEAKIKRLMERKAVLSGS